jgi:hypothetical protein
VWPNNKNLQDFWKVLMRNTVTIHPSSFDFYLPGHKADHFFEGSRVIIQSTDLGDDLFRPFTTYLALRDHCFPFCSELWLKNNGSIPTQAWFLQCLHHHFPSDVGGHSIRSGGATALAEAGITPHLIQAIGRWTSETFQIYVHHHPILLATLLFHHHLL